MGKKIDHQAQPENSEAELKNTHHQRQQNRIDDVAFTSGSGQWRQRRRCHQGDHRNWSGCKLTA